MQVGEKNLKFWSRGVCISWDRGRRAILIELYGWATGSDSFATFARWAFDNGETSLVNYIFFQLVNARSLVYICISLARWYYVHQRRARDEMRSNEHQSTDLFVAVLIKLPARPPAPSLVHSLKSRFLILKGYILTRPSSDPHTKAINEHLPYCNTKECSLQLTQQLQ